MDADKSLLNVFLKKHLIAIIAGGIFIKILLFSFVFIHAPQSKFMPDSGTYLKTSEVLASQGMFAVREADGSLKHEFNRTPGYPLFISVLNRSLRIPLSGVVLIQVLLTILAAFITYKAALRIEPKVALLSAVIVLYSPVISIFSLMILTETLFLLFMVSFMYFFTEYLKTSTMRSLILSSLMLVLAAYVRPGAYFLGGIVGVFIIYANAAKDMQRTLRHGFIFMVLVYGLLGLWQIRNYLIFKDSSFSSIFQDDPVNFGLYNSYSRNADQHTAHLTPALYYIELIWRCFWSVMSRPGSFKYFHSNFLTAMEKVLGYVWVTFWLSGFMYGITRIWRDRVYQFLLLIIAYFIFGSILAETWYVCERFRMPVIPFIAIISAYGWFQFEQKVCAKVGCTCRTDTIKEKIEIAECSGS